MIFQPRAYQARAIAHVLKNPRAALWMEMGLGKTAVTLSVIDTLISLDEVRKVLIVAPLRVARSTWKQEAEKWEDFQHLAPQMALVIGTAKERTAALHSGLPIHVINYDNLPWLFKTVGKEWDYDFVVLDESTRIKSPRSVWFKGKPTRKVRETDGKISRIPGHPGLKWASEHTARWLNLTGTPAPNGLLDLWSQTYVLDHGQRLGARYSDYRERWFESDYMGYTWTPKRGAHAAIIERMQDICLTLKASDYLDLPPIIENIIDVPLPADVMIKYRTLQREFFLELEQDAVQVANAATLSGVLLQATSGFLYTDSGHEELHTAKLDALADLVEDIGSPVLVAYHFKQDLARIMNRLPQARVLDADPQTVVDWNAGKIPVLLAHPRSAGHGLNLQHGGHHLVFYGLDWDLEAHQQIIERIGPTRQYQAGLDRPCHVHYLVSPGTIDVAVLKRLRTKATVQDVLKDAMAELAF